MIDTRLTRAFGLMSPIVLAPMAGLATGKLAAAVARSGGLGIVGTGTPDWVKVQCSEIGQEAVGVGFVSSTLTPDVLTQALMFRPRAIYLLSGDPRPFAGMIHEARVKLICQVQNLADTRLAVEAGAHVVVAHCATALGTQKSRAAFTFVPEVADFLNKTEHDTLLLASGGIADARGLAAAIVMGADGVVMDTRFLATQESPITTDQMNALIAANDDTSDQQVLLNTLGSDFGDGLGLIGSAPPVEQIMDEMSRKAERLLAYAQRKVVS